MVRQGDSRRALNDDQHNMIAELRLMQNDIKIRIQACKRQSGHDVNYNTRALEQAEMSFAEAFMWAIRGIANEEI